MRNPLKITLIILLLCSASISKTIAQDRIKTDFVHTVLFWLKHPQNQEEQQKFEASLKKFVESSAYIKSVQVGRPADTEERPVTDHSFSYCLSVTFASKEDHDKYQAEEVHKQFIKESEHLWEKVIVYDSESIW